MDEVVSRDKDDVLQVISTRIKRLRAAAELATQEIAYEERAKKLPKPNAGIAVSLMLTVVWIGGGLFLLYFVERRYGVSGFSIPLKVYLMFFLVFLIPLLYLYSTRRKHYERYSGEPDAPERVIKQFYEPLKEAIEKDDLKAMERIASRLTEDSLLASSFKSSHEGDPYKVAYALYAYIRFRQGVLPKEELEDAYNAVGNKVLKAMLSPLVRGENAGGTGTE